MSPGDIALLVVVGGVVMLAGIALAGRGIRSGYSVTWTIRVARPSQPKPAVQAAEATEGTVTGIGRGAA